MQSSNSAPEPTAERTRSLLGNVLARDAHPQVMRSHLYGTNAAISDHDAAPHRFMHHERLFQASLYSAEAWKQHSSQKRFLPEPHFTCDLLTLQSPQSGA